MDAVPHQENETTKPTEETNHDTTAALETKASEPAEASAETAAEPAPEEPAAVTAEASAEVKDEEAAPQEPVQTAEVTDAVAAAETTETVSASEATETVAVAETPAEPASTVEPAAVEPATVVEAVAAPVAEEPAATVAKKIEAARLTSEEQTTITRTLKFKPAPEPRWRRVLEQQGYKAAGVLVALGAGWILGAHSFASGPETREIIQALNAVTTRLEDVEHLTTRLNGQAQDVATLKASIASLRSIADANRAEAQVASAQLAARVSNMPKPAQQDMTPILRRLEQLEATVAALPASQPVAQQPVEQRAAPVAARIPADGYVLRRVSGNVAVIETGTGLRQIMVGDYLPGAGRVRRIERRNGEWLVITSGGIIDSQSY